MNRKELEIQGIDMMRLSQVKCSSFTEGDNETVGCEPSAVQTQCNTEQEEHSLLGNLINKTIKMLLPINTFCYKIR